MHHRIGKDLHGQMLGTTAMTIRSSRARGRQRQDTDRSRRSARSGFTIIELIVAIVIMVTGVLGLAGTAAMVSRMVGGAAQQTIAANVASSRFEKLRGVPCAQIVGGTETTRNVSETWTVTPAIGGTASLWGVRDSITYNAAGGRTSRLVFESVIRCP